MPFKKVFIKSHGLTSTPKYDIIIIRVRTRGKCGHLLKQFIKYITLDKR